MLTRFAPSPTGLLHLGHAYAAWRAWEEAKEGNGQMLLRLEDIDRTRCRGHYEDAIIEDLKWLGISWPEPVWRQSERMDSYAEALERLKRLDVLYPCFCTRAELIAIDAPHRSEVSPYPGTCRRMFHMEREERMASGVPYCLRLDVAKSARLAGGITWIDLNRGIQVCFPAVLGDVVLARKDIATSYHLAVTIDDAAQGVTVVTRGEDLFPSTHIHRLLQALLGLPVPAWRHHRLILDENGRRFAKRDESHSLRALREGGFSPADVKQLIDYP